LPDDGHGAMILLDNDLGALPDFLQHGGKVLGHLRFAHVDLRHCFDHTPLRLRRRSENMRLILSYSLLLGFSCCFLSLLLACAPHHITERVIAFVASVL
jgi:hypothetical protein